MLKNEPIIFLLRKMWRFAENHKIHVVTFWILSIIGNSIWLVPPLVFGKIINELQGFGFTHISFLLLLIASLFFIELLGWAFHGPSRILENFTGFKITAQYKKYLYGGVLSLPLSWHTDHDSGDTIDKVNKATGAMYDFSRVTFTIIKVFVRIIGTTAVLMYFNVSVGIVALIMLFVSFYIISRFDKKLVPQYKEINGFENKAQAKVFDALSNITTVKVLGIDAPILSSIMVSNFASYGVFKKNKIVMEWKWSTGGMLFTSIVVVPLLLYTWITYSGAQAVLIGTISILYLYLQNLIEVYYMFTGLYEDMIVNKARIQNVEDIENTFESINKVEKMHVEKWSTLTISNLNFAYDTKSERKEFDNFGLTLHRGERVALVGESGSGKSTLLKILHGMYDSTSAHVSFDNGKTFSTHFSDLDLASMLVPQEPEVFSASIRENITLLLDCDESVVLQAIDSAMFTDVVEQLPRKLESVVNEKGVNLSGGQKQRLALARALLFSKDKDMLLLDESTSSVDSINEVKIYKNIFEQFKNATIVASIHKMNLLKYFDRIVILEKGAIRNEGTFEELLKKDVAFNDAWKEFVLSGKGEE